MGRVSDEIRSAALDGRHDERAQRAAVYADAAPLLMDACSDAYYAAARSNVDPEGLKAALALCGEVTRAVWKALGYPAYTSGQPSEAVGLSRAEAEKARAATEKALKRAAPDSADDSALYHVRA